MSIKNNIFAIFNYKLDNTIKLYLLVFKQKQYNINYCQIMSTLQFYTLSFFMYVIIIKGDDKCLKIKLFW